MDFKLAEEEKLIQETARQFVNRELISREGAFLKQTELFLPPGDPPRRALDEDLFKQLKTMARRIGLWSLELPEAPDGPPMSMVARVLIHREFGRSVLPFAPVTIPRVMEQNNYQEALPVIRQLRSLSINCTKPPRLTDSLRAIANCLTALS
jgi:alkylation response protein AidB-like acyl-CoA dehydrogenase